MVTKTAAVNIPAPSALIRAAEEAVTRANVGRPGPGLYELADLEVTIRFGGAAAGGSQKTYWRACLGSRVTLSEVSAEDAVAKLSQVGK